MIANRDEFSASGPGPGDPPAPSSIPPGRIELHHEHLPLPTFWPAGLALGIALIFWGLISSLVIMVSGIVLFILCFAGWIHAIRHERKHHP